MLAVNTSVLRLVLDPETAVHAGDMAMAEQDRSQKLKLIGHTLDVDDVVAEDGEHKMVLTLEEEHIDS